MSTMGWEGGMDARRPGYQRWIDGLTAQDVQVRLSPLAFMPPGPFNGTWSYSLWDPEKRCWHGGDTTTLGEFETEALEALCEERGLHIVERLRWVGPLIGDGLMAGGGDMETP